MVTLDLGLIATFLTIVGVIVGFSVKFGSYRQRIDGLERELGALRQRTDVLEHNHSSNAEILARMQADISYIKAQGDLSAGKIEKMSEQLLLHLGAHVEP